MATIHEAIAIAIEHHQAGRLELAEQIYRRVLAVEPDHVDALHLLGVVGAQTGRLQMAAENIRRAVALDGSRAVLHNNLGNVLRRQGRPDDAIASYRRAIELQPDYAEAANNLGNALRDQARLEESAECYRRAIDLNPAYAEPYSNLGNLLRDQGRLDESAAIHRRALELAPRDGATHNNLGLTLARQGKLAEAIACYRQALTSNPRLTEAYGNLADALQNLGQFDEAIRCYERLVELKPDAAEPYNGLGNVLRDQGKPAEAIACYRRAIELKPGYAEPHSNLGNVLRERGELQAAIGYYARALALKPEFAEAHNNLGAALQAQGRLDEAAASHRRALELKPDYAAAFSNLLLTLQYSAGVTVAEFARASAEFDRRLAAPLRTAWRPHSNRRVPDRPLRLGFISPDFRRHPVGYFYLRPLECLRDDACQIICYSTVVAADDFTARFRAAAQVWRDVAGMGDDALAEQIRSDGIDMLFDVACHAAGNRLLVFARKPAPLQIAWAGPVGLSAIDYVLADRNLIPPGAEDAYRERTLRLPDAYACYEPPLEAARPTPLPAIERGHVTFGSLNNLAKITPRVIETWAAILRRLPGARLVIRYMNAARDTEPHDRLLESFARHGIGHGRLALLGQTSYAARLQLYDEIDLALDTFPFSGCTTTCESLWMGVPVVTVPGETYLSRQSLSISRTVGLEEPIAGDLSDYVERAVALASDLPRLARLRAGLREQMASSPMCDGRRFAVHLKQTLRSIWRDWCTGRNPA